MERPAEIEGHVIGDVDQGRDRPEADGRQPVLQPARARGRSSGRGNSARRPGGRRFPGRPADRGASGSGSRSCPCTGERSRGVSRPRPDAARSRAMPATPRQSARSGVTLTSISGSSSPMTWAKGAPTGRIGGQLDDAVMILAQPHLALGAEHAVGFDAADHPGLELQRRCRECGCRPARRRPSCRCAHWARRRPPGPGPLPVSTRQTRRRSALGCCLASTT